MTQILAPAPHSSKPNREQTRQPRRVNTAKAWTILFWSSAAAVSVVRLVVLMSVGAPSTVDGGHWLYLGHLVLSRGPFASGVVYPPLVPISTVFSCALFGDTGGVALVGVLCAAAPAVAVWYVSRTWTSPAAATAAGLVTLSAVTIGEEMAWGGYPQLLGLAFVVIGVAAVDRYLRTGRHMIRTAIVLALVAYTSHLELVPPALALILLVGIHLVTQNDKRTTILRVGLIGGMSALAVVPLVAIYARLAVGLTASGHSSTSLTKLQWSTLPSRLTDTFGGATVLWIAATVAALITHMLFTHRRQGPAWATHVALTGAIILSIIVTREPRYLYDIVVPIALTLGVWAPGKTASLAARRFVTAAVGVAILTSAVFGITATVEQQRRYQVLDQHLLSGLRWIDYHTPTNARFAVGPLHDRPLGWWVRGLTGRTVLTAAPLRWLYFPAERRESRVANSIFLPSSVSLTARVDIARRDNIRYLVYARRDTWYDRAAVDTLSRQFHRVFANGSVDIIDLAT